MSFQARLHFRVNVMTRECNPRGLAVEGGSDHTNWARAKQELVEGSLDLFTSRRSTRATLFPPDA